MQARETKRLRVLVADDNEELREALCDLLENGGGFEVTGAAGDGDAALALAKQQHPDVVLMDIKMPGHDGIETTRSIVRALPDTAVVVHTAYDDAGLVVDAVKAGARGYLLKGIDASSLFDALANVGAGGAAIASEVAGCLFDEIARQAHRERRRALEVEELASQAADRFRADPLTELLRLRFLRDALAGALADADCAGLSALLVLRVADLDAVNNELGWDAGDGVLVTASRAVCDAATPAAVAGRLDGNELGLVLPDTTRERAAAVAADIASRVHSTTVSESVELRTGIGIVTVASRGTGVDADAVLAAARDAARAATEHPSGKRIVATTMAGSVTESGRGSGTDRGAGADVIGEDARADTGR